MLNAMGLKKKTTVWRPPEGFYAVQTYVPKHIYEALQVMRTKNDRSLRAELRSIISHYVTEWVKQQKPPS